MKKDASGTIIGTTKKAPHGYGYCNICRAKNVHLSADGMLAVHGAINMIGMCPGSGKTPGHAPEKFKIVLGWVTTELEVVRARRTDLGELPDLKQVLVPKAVVWVNKGSEKDLEKAHSYAKAQKDRTVLVFTYPKTEKDPLERAKKETREIIVRYGTTNPRA
jgi:hypothetical protein